MPKEDTASQSMRRTTKVRTIRQETTLREAVVGRVVQSFELDGLDEARKVFEVMKGLFSGNHDWPDIEEEVMEFILEQKRLAVQADGERRLQMDKALIEGLSKGLATGQMNLLTGAAAQAFYHSTTTGGHK